MDGNDLSELFKNRPELSSLFPSLKTVFASIYQYQTALGLQKGFEYIQQLKSLVNSSVPLEQIKTMCDQCPRECKDICESFYQFYNENTNNLQNASTACSKLDDLYIAQVKSLNYLMVANAVTSLAQSVKAWTVVYQFQIPDYQEELAEAAAYIDRSAEKLKPMLETEKANPDDLNKIDDWLLSAHNILQRIRRDFEKKIEEAKHHRSNNILSAVVNVSSIVANLLSFQALATSAADTTFKAFAIGSSAVHGVCTVGDLIASGKAHELVLQLKKELAEVIKLQAQRRKLAAQVHTLR